MRHSIVLDSGPLGLLAHTKLITDSVDCLEWLRNQLSAGHDMFIPEIADFEVRRELLRLRATKGLLRLNSLLTMSGIQYIPIDTRAMRRAAELWADARRSGRPTADAKALDGDVILAAQVIEFNGFSAEAIIATTNTAHLSRYVLASMWRDVPS